jgi:hypothetical protein
VMARKREKLKGLDYQSEKYWEALLCADGLSMEAGTSRRVTYVGDSMTLEYVAGQQEMGTRDTRRDTSVTYQNELPDDVS